MMTARLRQKALFLAGVPGLFFLVPWGCASIDPTIEQLHARAGREFAIDDYFAARRSYEELVPKVDDDDARRAEARLKIAICLYKTGSLEKAAIAFSRLETDRLDRGPRREALLYHGHCERDLGLIEDPVLVERTPANFQEVRARTEKASDHYHQARTRYNRILDELDGTDFEARLRSAECLLRLGILEKSSQFLHKARTLLTECGEREPDHQEVLFLLGRAIQEDLGPARDGIRQPTATAAVLMVRALMKDREGSHSYHVAYRDVLAYLRQFPSQPSLELFFKGTRNENQPVQDRDLMARTEEMIELLESYSQEGRRPPGRWGTELSDEIGRYLTGYFDRERAGLWNNVRLAAGTIRDVRTRVYLAAYREAMSLLDEVPEDFRGQEEYINCRKEVQEGYVQSLLANAARLKDIGEWELAESNIDEALPWAETPFVEDATERVAAGQEMMGEIRALQKWESDLARIRELLIEGRVRDARNRFILARTNYGDDVLSHIKTELDAFARELELSGQSTEAVNITDLIRFWSEGTELLTTEPGEALTRFREAMNLVERFGGQVPYWRGRIHRGIAEACYRLEDYDSCLSELASLSEGDIDGGNLIARTEKDDLLAAMCYFRLGDYREASSYFDRVEDPRNLTEIEERMAAAMTYLEVKRFDRALTFYLALPRERREVREGLASCYDSLYRALWAPGTSGPLPDLPESEPLNPKLFEVMEELVRLDPKNYQARLHLGIAHYLRGTELKNLDHFARAYEHMVSSANNGVYPRTPRGQDILGRLVARFGKFVPSSVGCEWTYVDSNGGEKKVRIVDTDGQGSMTVVVQKGRVESQQVWRVDDNGFLHQFDEVNTSKRIFPVGLQTPDATRFPRESFKVIATRFRSSLIKTGVTCRTKYGSHRNCIQVEVRSDDGAESHYYFAPGVGLVRFTQGDYFYELTDFSPQARRS